MLKAKFVIATDRSYGIHPLEGIMQIHFDQMNVIAKHLEEIERERQQAQVDPNLVEPAVRNIIAEANMATDNPEAAPPPAAPPPPAPPPMIPDEDLAQQFSMKQAMKHADWPEFKKGQYKQLDQYWNQGMFSYPMPYKCYGGLTSRRAVLVKAEWFVTDPRDKREPLRSDTPTPMHSMQPVNAYLGQ